MAKQKLVFVCSDCGWESPKWAGQCRSCQAWGTLEEFLVSSPGLGTAAGGATAVTGGSPGRLASAVQPITEVATDEARALPSGVGEFDRVLGSGITPGAVILLVGEPGVGKSTLLLDVAAKFAREAQVRGAGPVLYATGEETASQVRRRAERIGALTPHLRVVAEGDLGSILRHVNDTDPSLIVVDSVQTVSTEAVEGTVGGVSQVKAVTSGLIHTAKQRNVPTILVGHVTKDGSLAGPRTLEHLVDVVCQVSGDRHTPLRLLRSVKNRYGATDEVGCFQLTDAGIEEVPDPSEIFMSQTLQDVPGSCVTVTLEGQRPLSTEIQALVTAGSGGSGRRAVSGLETSRVAMILAVLQAHLGADLTDHDVYVSTVGGARAFEPATDLAVALAVLSAAKGQPIPTRMTAIGEVGLTGDVRGCQGLSRRLQEAARLGFTHALVPQGQAEDLSPTGDTFGNIKLIPVRLLGQAAEYALS